MIIEAKRLMALCVVATLAACGGGTSSAPVSSAIPNAPAGNAGPASTSRISASASATILIPKKITSTTASQRKPQYVAASTQSITIQATGPDGWYDFSYSTVGPTSPLCTTVSAGLSCTVPFNAPPTTGSQTDTVLVYLYDNPSYFQGTQLASGNATMSVSVSQPNALSLVLGAIVGAQFSIGSASATATPGTAAQISYPIAGLTDYDGDVIGPTDAIDSPLKVTLSDTTTYTLVSPAPDSTGLTGNAPKATPIVLQYSGGYTPGHTTTLTVATSSMDSALINSYTGAVAPFTASVTLPY